MTSRFLRLSSVLGAVLALAGCSQAPAEAPGELIASDKQRVAEPNVSSGDMAELASANTDFGVALYRQVAKPGENLFLSPFSISQAFAMVYPGARGNTELQMQQALRFTLPQDRLHPAMNSLDLALQSRNTLAPGQKGTPPELRIVNGTWGQKGYAFEPAYLDTLALHYGAGMRAVDFKAEANSIREQINTWVEDQTQQRIKDLLPEGTVNTDTRLVLANAIYFKGLWTQPFQAGQTKDAPFHLLDGSQENVQMMERKGPVPTLQGEGFQALALPYMGDALRMLIIVPDEGRFEELEARLSAPFLDTLRLELKSEERILKFPKFQVDAEFSLKQSLQALGMVDAFTDSADFTGITTEERLLLTAAQHKAFVAVDEKGTEAAAATGVVAGDESAPPLLVVDRPFLFLIEDTETKAVLFLGRLVNP
ncbi:MAG TPA: serpin family protein [Myxococcaceae bacterium]|jgi:serpin B